MPEDVYGPEEDTDLLYEAITNYLKTNSPNTSLEIGVGNGKLSKLLGVNCKHTGVDINPHAITTTKAIAKGEFFESDLFENVSGKFDLIVFNPPYLPEHKKDEDDWITKAIVGGKHGYELIFRFLDDVSNHLTEHGSCLLLFSKLSKPQVILPYIQEHMLTYKEVAKTSVMMEEMYVYEIKRRPLRNHLESEGYTKIQFVAKGSHGEVYAAKYTDKQVAIKAANKNNRSSSAIGNEAEKLRFVNTLGIGANFLTYEKDFDYMTYEYIDGIHMRKWLDGVNESDKRKVFIALLNQCYTLDKAGFEKKEMTRPHKNVLITKDLLPVLIDFERGIFTEKPSNVTQFLQFLSLYFEDEKDQYREFAKEYAKTKDISNVVAHLLVDVSD